MTSQKKFISRRRAGLLFAAMAAAIVLAIAFVALLSPTAAQRVTQPATAGAIHITTGAAAVGTTSHSQALATTATDQPSAIPGLSAFASRDTLLVTLIAAAALLAIVAVRLLEMNLSDLRFVPAIKYSQNDGLKITRVTVAEMWRRQASRLPSFGAQMAGPLRR